VSFVSSVPCPHPSSLFLNRPPPLPVAFGDNQSAVTSATCRRHAVTLGLVLTWAAAVTASVYAHAMFLWTPPVARGDAAALEHYLTHALIDEVDDHRLGAAALVLMRNNRVTAEHAVGIANVESSSLVKPDRTLFVLASVSKAVTAWGVMKLVQDGALRLDEPVMPRLRRWQFPASPYRDCVTVRHLLSHTAGLDDGLGYGGFGPGQKVQTLEASLTHPADSTVGQTVAIDVSREPGTAMAYSGAGYAVLQLLIEEVTGRPFAEYISETVLRPLGMSTASFDWDAIAAEGRAAHLAAAYGAGLTPQPPRRYTARAAVGLYATARDVARFAQAFTTPNPVLVPDTLGQMLTAQPGTGGGWGLGHALFTDGGAASRIVGHDGGTPPGWGATMRVNLTTADAMVLLSSGGGTLTTRLADDWTYWQTGVVTAAARRQVLYDQIRPTLLAVAIGALAIGLLRRSPAARV